ncbi:TIGR03643 family protein [Leucothrix sargassi]|nr:TIGR03643 family protein [Leucothrix sargassi]
MSKETTLSEPDIGRIIEMAWEDRTPFEVIEVQYGLSESQVIRLMRKHMKASSFRMWRKRVSGRKTKHLSQRSFKVGRFVCPTQRLR